MQKGLWVARKRRNRASTGAKWNEQSLSEAEWPVLVKLPTMLPLPMNLTIVILMGQPCMFTQLHHIFNRIKNDKSSPCQGNLRECSK